MCFFLIQDEADMDPSAAGSGHGSHMGAGEAVQSHVNAGGESQQAEEENEQGH